MNFGNLTDVTNEVKAMAHAKTEGRCWYCGRYLTLFPKRDNTFTVDHIHPVSKGGLRIVEENLAPCCHSCNQLKSDRTIEQFRNFLGKGTIFYFEQSG